MAPLKIALFEPEAGGHHMVYVRNILREGLSRGWEMALVTTESAIRHSSYQVVAEEFKGRFKLVIMPDEPKYPDAGDLQKIKEQITRLDYYADGYRRLLAEMTPDLIYVINIENIDLPMALKGSPFGRTPFSGMLMGRHFHTRAMGLKAYDMRRRDKYMGWPFKRILKIPSLRRLLTLDETLVAYAQKKRLTGSEKVVYQADAANITLLRHPRPPREILGWSPDKFYVLNYGALSLRKGLQELIAAASHSDCPPDVCLVLAGRQGEDARELMAGKEAQHLKSTGRLIERDGFQSDEDESLLFQAADAVWVGYRHWYGMSGVLLQAAAAGCPVIAMDEGLVGYLTEKYHIGVTAKMSDPAALAGAISWLVSNPHLQEEYRHNGPEMAKHYDPDDFRRSLCDHIETSVRA